jgi:hypothetical protein
LKREIRVVVKWMDGWMDEWMVCGHENKFSLYPSPITQPWRLGL